MTIQGGGTILSVTGTGFSKDLVGSSLTVTIGNKACVLQTMNSNEITCLTPPSLNETTADIVLSLNNKTALFHGYTYNASNTPMVTSMSPLSSPSVLGGDLLTIIGRPF